MRILWKSEELDDNITIVYLTLDDYLYIRAESDNPEDFPLPKQDVYRALKLPKQLFSENEAREISRALKKPLLENEYAYFVLLKFVGKIKDSVRQLQLVII